jgi:hypothetical protein
MEKIIWTDSFGKEEVLHRVEEDRNILHTIKRGKTHWICLILCRNFLPKYDFEGNI